MRSSLFGGLLLLALTGCGGDPVADSGTPDALTLFSIDGRDEKPRDAGQGAETFHGYPVLGKVEIADAGQRKELVAALKDGIARRPKYGAKCFWPRHGLHVVEKGKAVEYVICFECSRFDEFAGGERLRHELINPDVQPTFDKPLKDAGVPIAPK